MKLSAALILILITLKQHLPYILNLSFIQPSRYPQFMMYFILKCLFQLLLLLSLLSIFDVLYKRWSFHKEQRMSKQDIKDEYRQKEGDPKIKSKIKQLQWTLRQKTASLNEIKNADVVITNPSHLAIALQYKRGLMPAPKVVCKGQDELARQIRILARKHAIPIIENKAFARLLYQSTDLNQWIDSSLYPIAAPIFRDLYQQGMKHS